MNRRMRTEILIQSSPLLGEQMANEITSAYEVIELLAPRQGLTMVKVRETAKNSLFYMGEILMTEAMVEIDGHVGVGMITGIEEQRARHLAIIDAAYEAHLPESHSWNVQLMEAEQTLQENKAREHAQLMKTKVSFDTMNT